MSESEKGKAPKVVGGFELITKVGQGAMGAVFKARQQSLDREVALKILPPSIARDEEFTKRFVREARASAKLTHPNIVSGIDVGQDGPSKLWYFAMEYVDGPTVRQYMTDHSKIEEDKALEITRDIARALECAHENKMVHRDVKPDNILLSSDGTAKLADLGLARQTQGQDSDLTQAGKALGTPNYMSPEQIRGEVDGLDTRTDLYALGATLFHMVTGQVPFPGESSAVIMAKHLTDPPPLANRVNPKVSQGCTKLIQRLMQKERGDRYQNPTQVIEQIDRLLKLPAAARSLTTGPRSPLRPKSTTGPRSAVRVTGARAPVRGVTTAAREIVQGRSDSIRGSSPRNSMALPLGIGAGVGIVAIIALIMAFTGGPTTNPPTKKRTTKPQPAAQTKTSVLASAPAKGKATEKELAQRWSAARKYARVNPENYAKILHKYRAVRDAAGSSPLASEVRTAMKHVEQQWDAAALKTWTALDAQIIDAVNASDYDKALALTAQPLPKEYAPRLKEKVDQRRQALLTEVNGKIGQAIQQAENALTEAKPVEGLKALESVAHIKYAGAATRILPLKERLQRESDNVAQLVEKRAVLEQQKKLDSLLDRFDIALFEGKDLSMAESVTREAGRVEWPDTLKPSANAMPVLLKAYSELRTQQADRLKALKGQNVKLAEGEGVIEKVQDNELHVTISLEGGRASATKRVTLAGLPAAERTRLLPPLTFSSDAAQVASAVGHLTKGQEDFPAAVAALEKAPDFPLTAHYRDVIRKRQLGAAEQLAEKAWKELAEAALVPLKKPIAEKLYERVLAFQSQHATTDFVKQHAPEIDALRARVAAVAKPNLLANGDFEGGDTKGWTLLGFRKGGDPLVEVTTDAAHGGKKGAFFKSSARLQQTIALKPGEAYEFSCWVRNSGAWVRAGMLAARKTHSNFRTGTARDFGEWTKIVVPFRATQTEHTFELAAFNRRRSLEVYFDEIQIAHGTSTAIPVAASKAPADAIRFQGSAYKAFHEPLSWEDAKAFCEKQGGHLVCVETKEENEFVVDRLIEGRMWIGGFLTPDGWAWVNGAPYEPPVKVDATSQRGEDYLTISTNRWMDTPRNRTLAFICEWAAPDPVPGADASKVLPPGGTDVAQPTDPAKAEPAEPGKAEPVAPVKVVPAAAQFVSDNFKLRGNWIRTFGSEGYAISGGPTKLPQYAKLSITGRVYHYKKEQKRQDTRGLQLPDGGKRLCVANYVRSKDGPLVIEVNLTDGRPHPVTLYLVDYVRAWGRCKISAVDPQTGKVLADRTVNYGSGVYVTFMVRGSVEFHLGPAAGERREQPNFHVSGVFFK